MLLATLRMEKKHDFNNEVPLHTNIGDDDKPLFNITRLFVIVRVYRA